MLLLTPLLRVAGHVGALLSDASAPLIEEAVGVISPLLALSALTIFFLGLDFDEDLAVEADLMALVRRSSSDVDLDDDAMSDDSNASIDSWAVNDLMDEIARERAAACTDGQTDSLTHALSNAAGLSGKAGEERSRDHRKLASSWLTAKMSLWNVAGFVVVIGTELPHGLAVMGGRILTYSVESGLLVLDVGHNPAG